MYQHNITCKETEKENISKNISAYERDSQAVEVVSIIL